jgi:hypothetical protein
LVEERVERASVVELSLDEIQKPESQLT